MGQGKFTSGLRTKTSALTLVHLGILYLGNRVDLKNSVQGNTETFLIFFHFYSSHLRKPDHIITPSRPADTLFSYLKPKSYLCNLFCRVFLVIPSRLAASLLLPPLSSSVWRISNRSASCNDEGATISPSLSCF